MFSTIRLAITMITMAVALAAGCTNAPHGTADVQGTLLGTTMTARDAIAVQDNATATGWFVFVTDYADACAHLQAGENVGSSHVLAFHYWSSPPGPPPVQTYTITNQLALPSWEIQFNGYNAQCMGGLSSIDFAIGGTLALENLDASSATGAFDLVFGGAMGNGPNEHVTGDFAAAVCAPPNPLPTNPPCR